MAPMSDQSGEKSGIRRNIRRQRAALPRAEARAAAARAIRRLWSLPLMTRARHLALYLPMGSELDCTPLAIEAWRRGRAVYLPVITGGTLRFAPYSARSALRLNRFGIAEPVTPVRRWRRANQLDVIVAPLVAFDVEGRRLGMGGGFYDRTLSFMKRRTSARRPRFIALAFEMQKVLTLPTDAWDVHLDAVVTETATYQFT